MNPATLSCSARTDPATTAAGPGQERPPITAVSSSSAAGGYKSSPRDPAARTDLTAPGDSYSPPPSTQVSVGAGSGLALRWQQLRKPRQNYVSKKLPHRGEPALSDLIVPPAFADFSGVKTQESPMDINKKSFKIMVNC